MPDHCILHRSRAGQRTENTQTHQAVGPRHPSQGSPVDSNRKSQKLLKILTTMETDGCGEIVQLLCRLLFLTIPAQFNPLTLE